MEVWYFSICKVPAAWMFSPEAVVVHLYRTHLLPESLIVGRVKSINPLSQVHNLGRWKRLRLRHCC